MVECVFVCACAGRWGVRDGGVGAESCLSVFIESFFALQPSRAVHLG